MNKKLFGSVFIVIGLALVIISGTGITGGAIGAKDTGTICGILGIILIIISFTLFREGNHGFRSRDSLRHSNAEARAAAIEDYQQEHNGESPTDHELREHIRKLHERGDLTEVVKEYHELMRHKK
jgi:hypothetical protein